MGGFIRSIISPSQSKANRAREAQATADRQAAEKRTAQLTSEADAEKRKSQKKLRTAGRRRTVLTSPLGLSDTNLTQSLGQ